MFNYFFCWDLKSKFLAIFYLFLFTERVQMQKRTYEYLLNNHECKKSLAVSLEEEIKELNQKLYEKNEMIRSQFEIDNLKNEIRNLTNEKAQLEVEISKSELIYYLLIIYLSLLIIFFLKFFSILILRN